MLGVLVKLYSWPVRGTNEVHLTLLQRKSALPYVDSTASASEIKHLHSRMAVLVPLPMLSEPWLFIAWVLLQKTALPSALEEPL